VDGDDSRVSAPLAALPPALRLASRHHTRPSMALRVREPLSRVFILAERAEPVLGAERTNELRLDSKRPSRVLKQPQGEVLRAVNKQRDAKEERGERHYAMRDWARWMLRDGLSTTSKQGRLPRDNALQLEAVDGTRPPALTPQA
jgi:hypothetical protein